MAWQTIFEANSLDELKSVQPSVADIPAGSSVQIQITLPWWLPIGQLGDLAGNEFWVEKFAGTDFQVNDVSGDWHNFYITGTAKGMGPLVLAAIIIIALSAVALAFMLSQAYVKVQADIVERQQIAAQTISDAEKFLEIQQAAGISPDVAIKQLQAATGAADATGAAAAAGTSPFSGLTTPLLIGGLILLAIAVVPSIMPRRATA